MGIRFPDGMTVIEGPNLGFLTDPMIWGTSHLCLSMIFNDRRELYGLMRLHLYVDKIFRTDDIVIAA